MKRSPFKDLNIMVCGEVCIDRYISGKSYRKSPEADCPVVNELTTVVETLGMCGNVVKNIEALGAKASLFSVIGQADNAAYFIQRELGFPDTFVKDLMRPTIEKVRLLSNDVQIARLDLEKKHPLDADTAEQWREMLFDNIYRFDAVILQDYGKGLWNTKLLKDFINHCNSHDKKVFVDPYKNRKITDYKKAYLIKANLIEAQKMSPVDHGITMTTLTEMLHQLTNSIFVVTLGQNGLEVSASDRHIEIIPVKKIDVVDVTGAGDTALSVMTLALLSGMSLLKACRLAVKASGLSIQQQGPGRVTWKDL